MNQWAVRSQEVETTVMSAMSTGRPKVNPIWEYFDHDETSKISVCKIENSGKVERGKKIKVKKSN